MTNEEAREHMDMLIQHKDKALETYPYFKRCDSCIHSEERDGSNCYECIKGMANNFEAQPTDADCISRSELLRHQHIIYDDDGEDYKAVYVKDIKAMPSVTPQAKVGHWIYTPKRRLIDETDEGCVYITDYRCTCSECGGDFGFQKMSDAYCKYCGAEMSGGGEE